jgi:hypothetical protein
MGTRGVFLWGVKQPGREADNSPPTSAEVKEWVELYLHSLNTPSWHGAQLKHRDTFTINRRKKSTPSERVVRLLQPRNAKNGPSRMPT